MTDERIDPEDAPGVRKLWPDEKVRSGDTERERGSDHPAARAFHERVEAARGTARRCERCGTTEARNYDWANLTNASTEQRQDPLPKVLGGQREH